MKFEVWNDNCPNKPSYCDMPAAERQLVAVLLFELQREVDFVLSSASCGVHALALIFERLEVPELVQPLDAVFQRLRC